MEEREERFEHMLELVRSILESGDTARLRGALSEIRGADSADVLSALSEEQHLPLLRAMDRELASETLAMLDEGIARQILSRLGAGEIADLLDLLPSDDQTDLINLIPPEHVPAVLRRISREDYEDVAELLKFDDETAGGIMAREILTVRRGLTIQDVVDTIRKEFKDVDHIQSVYVIDANGTLLGTIPLVHLLVEEPARRVEDVMDTDPLTVRVDTDQEEVAAVFARYDLYSLPVVDQGGRLAGRITVDDIIDVIEEEANEDITMMAGTGDEEFWERSPLRLSRARLPWLLTGLFGGITSALVMNHFKASIESVLALAFFVPVITAMGGNVGIQSSAIVVRELATGGISIVQTGSKLLRELKVALINGVVIATVLLGTVWLWRGDIKLGLLLGTCMFAIILWATVLGALIPMLLKRINVDPALATGPFITTFNDILGIVFYLGIATLFLDWIGRGP
jgi:magnesium transporter